MMRRTLTWKAAVAGGAVLGAGFGAIALAGADDPSTPPDGVELREIDRTLSSPGAPLSVLPAPAVTATESVASPASPAPAPAGSVQSAPSIQSAPSAPVQQAPAPAPVVDDSPDSPPSAPAPAPAVDDSPESPASPASVDSMDS